MNCRRLVAAVRSVRVRPIFAWYDAWVGAFYDRERRRLYLLPVPCAGVVVQLPGAPRAIDEHVDARDDLIHTLWLYIGRHTEKQLTTAQKELLYDIVYGPAGGDRWWRCTSCDHASLHHIFGPGGLAVGGPRPCENCSCPNFKDRP